MKLKSDYQFKVGDEFLCNGTDIVRVLEVDTRKDTVGFEVEFTANPNRPNRIDARYRDRLIEALNLEEMHLYYDKSQEIHTP
jgi:hypothetical protein